ncbi:hypothetical protein [Pseudoalteromonas sp. T1lg23B]|uniref:hypothetical protein n=1 Tax=Pseudoalteromonas sp. T1lg23B TaxID=2077097 RepID=UPI000CF60AA3|nr:hypothetical protein [Pseudoalteromonas sp. T1lg23B]
MAPQKDDVLRLIGYFAVHNNSNKVRLFRDYLQKNYSDSSQSILELREYLHAQGYEDAVKLLL